MEYVINAFGTYDKPPVMTYTPYLCGLIPHNMLSRLLTSLFLLHPSGLLSLE